jgi:uncharacterized protein YbaR (Trm112 family)
VSIGGLTNAQRASLGILALPCAYGRIVSDTVIEENLMVSQDLLDILRCPYCVSGETRRPGDDPGRLQLINNVWLVCTEEGCNRKYPIREDIPIMLIEEGDKYRDIPVEKLGQP